MMVETAQTFSSDQINAFFLLAGTLILSNIGGLTAWAIGALKKKWKKDQDLNAAFKRIRKIESVLNLQNESEDSKEIK